MDRRSFLKTSAIASAVSFAPFGQAAFAADTANTTTTANEQWRTFDITTRVELNSTGAAGVWLPIPTVNTDYQKVMETTFKAEGGKAQIVQDPKYGAGILVAEFSGAEKPVIEVTTRVMTRDRAVDLAAAPGGAELTSAERKKYTAATDLLPTDGIVRQTAKEITKDVTTDVDRARALYEWIVDNTYRDAKVRGCGVGDIKSMLESKNLGGKCGDLNALFVGLARSIGIPARDVYGIRVADSKLGYKSLGKSGDITKAQHCRAEFHLAGYGWVPVDPADVRKVVLEEGGGLPLTDVKVEAARKRLFGSWEMNWLAFNYAHDVQLPGDVKGKIGFFMYPNATITEDGKPARVDSLDPDNFKYKITSREIVG
ncbi:transglutaminase-like domain-containing protein [Actimicrobium antarcticum]|uniref:Transglutaminase family protein n=1 Tax=Actimicrobium antarcticum TaxID=1051899 RepID=A0ABP7TKR6_9BURK